MNYREFVERELKIIGMLDSNDQYNQLLCKNIFDLVDVFSTQGHSGFSASCVIDMISKLLSFKPLSPLRGTDDEWFEVGEQEENGEKVTLFQNNRCGSVFKTKNRAYYIDGIIFENPNGATYTNSDSVVNITFPFTPFSKRVKMHE